MLPRQRRLKGTYFAEPCVGDRPKVDRLLLARQEGEDGNGRISSGCDLAELIYIFCELAGDVLPRDRLLPVFRRRRLARGKSNVRLDAVRLDKLTLINRAICLSFARSLARRSTFYSEEFAFTSAFDDFDELCRCSQMHSRLHSLTEEERKRVREIGEDQTYAKADEK